MQAVAFDAGNYLANRKEITFADIKAEDPTLTQFRKATE